MLVDVLAAILGVLLLLLAATIKRVLTLHDYIRSLSERVSWLEAKLNGKPN